MSYTHLTPQERFSIEVLFCSGLGPREISLDEIDIPVLIETLLHDQKIRRTLQDMTDGIRMALVWKKLVSPGFQQQEGFVC